MAGRKKRGGGTEGEHENSERWLLTYADMITLLVAFFIMLYSMSVMNQAKFQQLAISVRSGFGASAMNGVPTVFSRGGGQDSTPALLTSSKAGQPVTDDFLKSIKAQQDSDGLDKAYQIVKAYIHKNHLQSMMQVARNERGVVVTVMTDKMLFARGDADLRPEELSLLHTVANVTKTVPLNPIRVEGHTDSLPIHTERFPSNWELSTTRATTVLRYFEACGVASKRLEASGYADQRPLAPNDTEANRATNRRVEIVLLRRYPQNADTTQDQ
jgi:chemotaxis protein MotB